MFNAIALLPVAKKMFLGFPTLCAPTPTRPFGVSAALQHKLTLCSPSSFLPLIALLILPLNIQAQPTTLDQAIEMAVAQTPRLRAADASIERAQAARGASWELAPTSVEYSWGQLNGVETRDRQISINQSIGSLITPFYKNALVKQQVSSESHLRELVRREVTAEVKRAWAYLLYTQDLCRLYRDQNALAEQIQRSEELRFAHGDITKLERDMTATIAASMRSKLFQAEEERRIAALHLQWSCFSPTPLQLTDTTQVVYTIDLTTQHQGIEHRSYFESQVSVSSAMASVEKSRFFPELSVGFQRQNMLPDKGLNAYTVGASFPIFFNSQRSRIRQAKAEAYIARNNADTEIRALEYKITAIQSQLKRYDETIRFYTSSALDEANALIQSASMQLKLHETAISEFVQSLNSALEIRRGYADALYQYNIAAVEYELYR